MFEPSYKTKRSFFERPKKKIDKIKSRKVTMKNRNNRKHRTNKEK